MTDILNLDYHRRRLTVIALNKAPTISMAAILLGVTERTVYNWIQIYEITKREVYK